MTTMTKRGEAGIEAMIILGVLLLLLTVVFLAVFEKNLQASEWEERAARNVACEALANAVTEVYALGPESEKNLTLPYDFNVTVYGQAGFITVEDYRASASCRMPAGAGGGNTSFTLPASLTFTNNDGTVVITGG